jgi:DNA-binding MarR family transcriptional regulator
MQSAEIMRPEQLAGALDARLAAVWRLLLRGADRPLSRTATSVLALLRDRGPQRITTLAEAESVAQPTMTTLVARIEREGYVSRSADPDDGRAALIELTDAGRDVLARFGAERAALLAGPLAELGDDERARLDAALPALDALIQTLKEQS